LKSRASEPKSRRFQCPSLVLVGWVALKSNAELVRRLELGAKRACVGVLVFNRR